MAIKYLPNPKYSSNKYNMTTRHKHVSSSQQKAMSHKIIIILSSKDDQYDTSFTERMIEARARAIVLYNSSYMTHDTLIFSCITHIRVRDSFNVKNKSSFSYDF